mgnify:CR=1 FL=1
MRQLTTSTYKNSFLDYKQQKQKNYDYIVGVLHERFPNPQGYRFSNDWALRSIKHFLNNKRSRIRRQSREAMANNNTRCLPPGGVHNIEWKYALKEVHDGVQFP